MERPTEEQVDESLELIDKGDPLDRSPMALVLAAEVRALRELLTKEGEYAQQCKTAGREAMRERDAARAELEKLRGEYQAAQIWAVTWKRERDFARADLERAQKACGEMGATIGRVSALGSGPGYRMGDDTLVKLGDVRAALRGAGHSPGCICVRCEASHEQG